MTEEYEFVCRPAYWLERSCLCPAFGMAHRPDQHVYESIQPEFPGDDMMYIDEGGEA